MLKTFFEFQNMLTRTHRKQHPQLPIYTLSLPKGKLYIVTGPDLVYAVDRQPKAFSFNPIVIHFAQRLFGATPESVEKLSTYTQGRHGEGLTPEMLKAQHDILAPGQHLASMDAAMLQGVVDFFDIKSKNFLSGQDVPLCAFFRDLTTIASTRAVYGNEQNPFDEKDVRDGLWYVAKLRTYGPQCSLLIKTTVIGMCILISHG